MRTRRMPLYSEADRASYLTSGFHACSLQLFRWSSATAAPAPSGDSSQILHAPTGTIFSSELFYGFGWGGPTHTVHAPAKHWEAEVKLIRAGETKIQDYCKLYSMCSTDSTFWSFCRTAALQ
ncbi:hypothetical protein BS78_10G169600 [Paspalum vaginatum]|nr:hypothetical protein BS78_10G169600 [Paspalum vaginatum]